MFDASHVEQLFSSTTKTLQRSTLVLSERVINCRSNIMNENRNNIKNKMCNVISSSTIKAPFVSAVGNTSLKHLITSLHRLASFSDYVNTCNDLSRFIEHKMTAQVTEKTNSDTISSNSNNNQKQEKQRTNDKNVFHLFKSITNALCTATLGEYNTNKINSYGNDGNKEKRDKDYCFYDSKTQHWSELWYSEEEEMIMENSSHNICNSINNYESEIHNDVNAIKDSSSSLRSTNEISPNMNTQRSTLSNISPWDATQRQGECTGASLTRLLCVNAFIVNAWYLLSNALERITKCYKKIMHEAELEGNTENMELESEWTIQEQNYNKLIDTNLSLCLSQLSQLLPRPELFKVFHTLLELLQSENILTEMLFPAVSAYALQHNMSTLNSRYILGPLEDVAHSLYSDYLQSEKNFAHHCYDVLCMLSFYINAFVSIHFMKEEKEENLTRMVQQLRHVHEILLFALESTFHASNARPEMSRAFYTHLVKPYHNVVSKVILNKPLKAHLSQGINSIYMTAEYRLLLIVESVAIAEKHMSSGQRSLSLQQQRYAHLLTSSDGKMTINLLTTITEDKNLLCEETTLRSPNGHRVYKIHEMEFAEDIKHGKIDKNNVVDGQHKYNPLKTENVSLYVYVDHGVIYYKRSNKLRQSFTPATSVDELFSCF